MLPEDALILKSTGNKKIKSKKVKEPEHVVIYTHIHTCHCHSGMFQADTLCTLSRHSHQRSSAGSYTAL